MQLSAERINISGGTQARRQLCEKTVQEYREAMEEGATFPPVKVFYDGKDYWLADGFHRTHAALKTDAKTVDIDVATGTRRDAILYAVGANATHGLKRNNDDKHDAVLTLLDDDEWREWSDREVAKRCNVSPSFVAKIRKEMTPEDAPPTERTYTNKHGQEAKMQTANIGKSEPKESPVTPPKPAAVKRIEVTEEIPQEWKDAQEADEGEDSSLIQQLEAAHATIAAYEKGSANLRDLVNENTALKDELKREKQSKNFYLDKSGRLTNEIKARDSEIAKLKAHIKETA